MEITGQNLKGVFLITLKPNRDERGFFMRTYDSDIFTESALNMNWVQENHSLTIKKGTIRGLHFQLPPYTESKLVRCTRGAILDVYVDLRSGSPDFGKWEAAELSENNYRSLFIPKGLAHGFCTLTDHCEVQYKVDSKYTPTHDCGIVWNDPDIGIQWPTANPFLSQKDATALTLKAFRAKYHSITV